MALAWPPIGPFSTKWTPAEIFRLPIFANTFFSQRSTWGLCSPFLMLGLGVVLIVIGLFMGWGLIDPFSRLGCC